MKFLSNLKTLELAGMKGVAIGAVVVAVMTFVEAIVLTAVEFVQERKES